MGRRQRQLIKYPRRRPNRQLFWARMQWMMDTQSADTNSRIEMLGRHVAGVEGRINLKIAKETKARHEENAAMTEAMQDLTKRIPEPSRPSVGQRPVGARRT